MSRLDYSKWDKIEISDDEDDTHPNVDTPSLFKWRHEARVERKKQQEEEKAKRKAQLTIQEQKINFLRKTKEALAKEAEEGEASEASKAQLKGVEEELARLQVEHDEFTKKEAELERWEREHPTWDVDNISQEKSSRTIINGYKETKPEKKDDVDDMTSFFKKHGDEVEAFAKLTKYEDSHKFLNENKHLVTDHTASYLVIYCVDLAVEEKEEEMKRAAHQTIIIQYILELAKSMKRHPVECLQPFFVRMAAVAADGAGNEYKAAFNDELNSLIQRVRDRAVARLEEAQAKMEAERKAQLKPGELDPLEVLESLPEKIKKAFKAQDTPMLQQGFAELSPEDAKYHYDRVVKSGLWVPAGGDGDEEEEGEAAAASS